jgi:hypothetical protein
MSTLGESATESAISRAIFRTKLAASSTELGDHVQVAQLVFAITCKPFLQRLCWFRQPLMPARRAASAWLPPKLRLPTKLASRPRMSRKRRLRRRQITSPKARLSHGESPPRSPSRRETLCRSKPGSSMSCIDTESIGRHPSFKWCPQVRAVLA